jgi:hypothetical protein
MADAVDELVSSVTWKLRTLLRTRRFYSTADMLCLYKAHVLSFIEYRTAAIYHALREALTRLDRVQEKFLEDIGISSEDALLHFNLAPLESRRDMAMLGLIHRTAMGKGPKHFRQFFQVAGPSPSNRHRFTLVDQCSRGEGRSTLRRRSAFGLIQVYNKLLESVVETRTVKAFQQNLQGLLKSRAASAYEEWWKLFSPRVPAGKHQLL